MAWCMLSKYLLIGILLISPIPTPEARRKKDDNADGIIECFLHFACECGNDAEIEFMRDCLDLLGNRTQTWALNQANDADICPGITEKISIDARQFSEVACHQDRKYLDPCLSKVNGNFRIYFAKLNVSPFPNDQEDNRKIQKVVDCMVPAFKRCQDFPGECM